MKNHQHINADSGDVEYYTPARIVEAARSVLGRIDLDPASSQSANQRIKATRFFSKGGLSKKWRGRVWMNHPFSRHANPHWIKKLVRDYKSRDIVSACCITFAATSEVWFAPLMDYPQCYLRPRTNYHLPDGTLKRGVTKGSVVTYLGRDIAAFKRHFSKLGKVKI